MLTEHVCDPNLGDTLPVAVEEPKIVDELKTHDKIGLQAPTGSGKTMKLPGIVLEHFKRRAVACLVLVSILCRKGGGERFMQARTLGSQLDAIAHQPG